MDEGVCQRRPLVHTPLHVSATILAKNTTCSVTPLLSTGAAPLLHTRHPSGPSNSCPGKEAAKVAARSGIHTYIPKLLPQWTKRKAKAAQSYLAKRAGVFVPTSTAVPSPYTKTHATPFKISDEWVPLHRRFSNKWKAMLNITNRLTFESGAYS